MTGAAGQADPRYAVYWTPAPDTPLAQVEARLFHGTPELRGVDPADLAEAVRTPAHYGLHATLKAPFHLIPGASAGELHAAVEGFARGPPPVEAPALQVAELGGYLALRPGGPAPELDALAASAVRAFDGFRRPPDADELARRRGGGLTAQQDDYLRLWGYAYVFDAFRFHVTLAGPCDAATRGRLMPALEAGLAPALDGPFRLDALSLAMQPDRGSPFQVAARYPLQG